MSTNNTFKKYRVVKEIYPSGRVRYEQDLSDEDVEARTATYKVGEYSTLQQAQKAAKKARDRTGQFDGWAEEFYLDEESDEDGLWFYCTGDCPDYLWLADEDEDVSIYIKDMDKVRAKNENAMAAAKHSEAPERIKPTERKFGVSGLLSIFLKEVYAMPISHLRRL